MKERAIILLVVAAVGLKMACAQIDCLLSHDFCARLHPGMVVFIGKEAAIEEPKSADERQPRFGTDIVVTFTVEEALWGLDPTVKNVRVHLRDGYSSSIKAKFLAVSPREDGSYFVNDCGGGLALPVDDAWAREFRKYLKHLTPATVPVQVVASRAYTGLPNVQVQLKGAKQTFKETTSGSGLLVFSGVAPGTYSLSVTKENYSLPETQRSVSILPGSCSVLRVTMQSASSMSGQVIDSGGNPVRNMRGLYAIGWSAEKNAQDYGRSQPAETDGEGRFLIDGLMPGQYYLGTNIWESREPRQSLFPRTYYPGVPDRASAQPLIIEAGKSLDSIVFQLRDYGKKRRLTVRVMSEDGLPVPHAIVEDGPAEIEEVRVSSIGESQYTDERGIATFDAWASSEYSIDGRLVLPNTFYQSQPIRISAGDSDSETIVVLKGLHLRVSN